MVYLRLQARYRWPIARRKYARATVFPLAMIGIGGWFYGNCVGSHAQEHAAIRTTSDSTESNDQGGVQARYAPKRVNKCVELLEQGQPIYYNGGGGYEDGKTLIQAWAGSISYDVEHAPFVVLNSMQFVDR